MRNRGNNSNVSSVGVDFNTMHFDLNTVHYGGTWRYDISNVPKTEAWCINGCF